MLSYRAEQERLQNEMNLAYQVYTQVSQQLQMARAEVQEITPCLLYTSDAVYTDVGTSARALAGQDAGKVACTVADEGHRCV